MEAEEILKTYRTIAVVGCSRDGGKPSHYVPAYLKQHGYRIIPVNPFADDILGEKAYKSLSDVPVPFDIVEVFRPSDEALGIVKQAVEKSAKAVWLQEGISSEDAKKYAEKNKLAFVQDRCMMVEHRKLRLVS